MTSTNHPIYETHLYKIYEIADDMFVLCNEVFSVELKAKELVKLINMIEG